MRWKHLKLSILTVVLVSACSSNGSEVVAGDETPIHNATECQPGEAAVILYPGGFDAYRDAIAAGDEVPDPIPLGTLVADADGHFDTTIVVPDSAPRGEASIVVECAAAGQVLNFPDIEIVDDSSSWAGLGLLLAGLVGVAAVAGLLLLRSRRGKAKAPAADDPGPLPTPLDGEDDGAMSDDIAATEPMIVVDANGDADLVGAEAEAEASAEPASTVESAEPPGFAESPQAVGEEIPDTGTEALPDTEALTDDPTPAETPAATVADLDEDDDGAEYWFWEIETSRGPARRLACLTDHAFHLHEVPEPGLDALLEQISDLGPDMALARAFLRVPVADVEAVHRRGTQVRFTYHTPEGSTAKTLDLGDQVDGVVSLLNQRFEVVEVPVG